jgi:hypothetical protein
VQDNAVGFYRQKDGHEKATSPVRPANISELLEVVLKRRVRQEDNVARLSQLLAIRRKNS